MSNECTYWAMSTRHTQQRNKNKNLVERRTNMFSALICSSFPFGFRQNVCACLTTIIISPAILSGCTTVCTSAAAAQKGRIVEEPNQCNDIIYIHNKKNCELRRWRWRRQGLTSAVVRVRVCVCVCVWVASAFACIISITTIFDEKLFRNLNFIRGIEMVGAQCSVHVLWL